MESKPIQTWEAESKSKPTRSGVEIDIVIEQKFENGNDAEI